jgi:hypothetical protein
MSKDVGLVMLAAGFIAVLFGAVCCFEDGMLRLGFLALTTHVAVLDHALPFECITQVQMLWFEYIYMTGSSCIFVRCHSQHQAKYYSQAVYHCLAI